MKVSNKKGFTLAELLIVIAIIAILVAIMIPVFGSALQRAEKARDLANVRAAYAELITDKLVNNNYNDDGKIEIPYSELQTKATVEAGVIGVADSTITVHGDSDYTFTIDSDVVITGVPTGD